MTDPFRPIPPSQPPGWVDPDPLYVDPEPVVAKPVRRRRYQGWQLDDPVPHWFAWFGLGVCVGVVLLAIVITLGKALDVAGGPVVSVAAPVASHVPPRPEAPVPSPAAEPTGEIGTALIGGWATYYATCGDCAAAGPLLQAALGPTWKGQTITVASDHGQVDLRLVTSCACGDRRGQPTIIDVSIEAFNELSPIAAGTNTDPGLVMVSIEIGGPGITLPPTDLPPHPDDDRMRDEVRGDELYR